MRIRAPFRANKLINAVVRTVPGIAYAAPHSDASETMRTPAVVWSAYDSEPKFSYQDLIGTTHILSFHVAAATLDDADRIAGEVWAALLNAPSLDLSQVDSTTKIKLVYTNDSPVENRTPGQQLNFYEFRFSVYVTVGPA